MKVIVTMIFGAFVFINSLQKHGEASDVIQYYHEINKANRAVYKCDYSSALLHFQTAFSHSPPFYHDLKNVLLLSSEINRHDLSEEIFNDIIYNKKMSKSTVKKELEGMIDSALLDRLVDKMEEPVLDDIKKKHWRFLLNLVEKDQKFRVIENEEEMTEDWKKERLAQDSANLTSFIHKYRKYGFLGENELGVWYKGKKLWDLYFLLFRHFVQNKWGNEILSILKKEYLVGKIPVQVYATMVDLDDNMNRRFSSIQHNYITTIGVRDCRPLIKTDKESMDLLNYKRLKLGLDSFHVVMKQAFSDRYCQKGFSRKYNFVHYSIIEIFPAGLFTSEKNRKYLNELAIRPEKIKPTCNCELFY